METLVLNREQALHLQKDLGLDMSDAKLCFFEYPLTFNSKGEIRESQICIHGMEEMKNLGVEDEVIPTYTLQEILDKLPNEIPYDDFGTICELNINLASQNLEYNTPDKYYLLYEVFGEDILTNAYEMLCWVIENGHLKTK